MKALIYAWNEFFFRPQSPTPIALFRILYGALVMADLMLLKGDWLAWFGPKGWISPQTMHILEPGTRINLFSLMPQTDFAVETFFWIFLAFTALLMIGLFTRLSSIAVFVCLCSMHERLTVITHSGDTLMRVIGFFLMFAPAGAAFSVDRLIRIWRGKEGLEIRPRSPWAQRMIQYQVALLYFVAFWWKSAGETWVNGTALYYVYHLDQFRRFPVPDFLETPCMMKIGSWATLLIEFSLGVLVWFKELRYAVLLAGVLLHLALEYSMNIPLFEWISISTFVTFIYPADLAQFGDWIRTTVSARVGRRFQVTYDPESERAVRAMNVLHALDVFRFVRIVESQSAPPEVLAATAGKWHGARH